MASVKKRLKKIEAALSRFAADEKRLVDLIVGLVVENLERRMAHRLEAMAEQITQDVREEVVRDVGRHFPDREDVQDLVEQSMLRALRRHADETRAHERRSAAE